MELYFNRVKRFDDATIEEICAIDEYFKWNHEQAQPKSEARKYSFEEWSGIKYSELNIKAIKFYARYFYKRYLAWDWKHERPVYTIAESVAYLENANHIIDWLEHNTNGEITELALCQLLNLCMKVRKHHDKAPFLLPMRNGFFNGSKEYDSAYFRSIDDAIEQIAGIICDTDFETEMIYYQ